MSTAAQKILIRMHSYRIAGTVFAILGVFVFATVYTNVADGDFMRLLEKPSLMIWLISPFLPSSLMFWFHAIAEKKLRRLLEQSEKSA